MSIKVTILGCGASNGVPVIGCDCAVCRADNPKNTRLRASVLFEINGFKLLVDLSPDLRQQALRHDLSTVDAIIVTHAHADHIHGIDEVKSFNFHRNASIPMICSEETWNVLKDRFAYVFQPPVPQAGWFRPSLEPVVLPVTEEPQLFNLSDSVTVEFFRQVHGRQGSLGLRIGNIAYSTDVNHLPEESWQSLGNLDLWIVDCLRHSPAPTHAHLEMSLGWIERAKPKRAVLTHMSHDMDYQRLRDSLPAHIEPAYDGLVISL